MTLMFIFYFYVSQDDIPVSEEIMYVFICFRQIRTLSKEEKLWHVFWYQLLKRLQLQL